MSRARLTGLITGGMVDTRGGMHPGGRLRHGENGRYGEDVDVAAGTTRRQTLYDRLMTNAVPALKLKAQFTCGGELAIGPGKADLLDAITATGSISAAGRRLGLSYRRAWLMADTMNRCWREPLVATAHGGARGGGARLTPLGETVLRRYRDLEVVLATAANQLATDLAVDLLAQPRPAHLPE